MPRQSMATSVMSLPFNRVSFGKGFHGSVRLRREANKVREADARPPGWVGHC